jgi:hypothetical protein
MQKKYLGIILLVLLALSITVNALSADEAVAIVSIQNNYLMDGVECLRNHLKIYLLVIST